MSEYSPHGEYEELPRYSPIGQYYSDVNRGIHSETLAKVAVGEMLQGLPFVSDLTFDRLITSEYMPFEQQYEIEPRIAKEKLLLMPLAIVGPKIDESYCSIYDVKNWYDDVIAGIVEGSKAAHSDECFRQADNSVATLCNNSTVCPRRYLDRCLRGDTLRADFSTYDFYNNPQRARTIALDKLELGITHEILPPEETKLLIKWYQLQFEQWMVSRPNNQTPNKSS